jgi:hypothetical protein
MHEGMAMGEKLRDKSAMLILNMASILLHNNLVLTDDKSFKSDDTFIESFQMFVDNLPANAFGKRNGKREIILQEVKQVLKVLFEGATKRPECVQFFNNFFTKFIGKIGLEKIINVFRSNKKKGEELNKEDIEKLKGQKEEDELVFTEKIQIIDGVKQKIELTEE